MRQDSINTHALKSIPMRQVVSLYGGPLKRVGARINALCPWHDDHTPSLTLYEDNGNNHCHCFACGAHGDVIDYVRQQEQCDFQTACDILSRQFGIDCASGAQPTIRLQTKQPVTKEQPPVSYIPMQLVEQMQSTESSFCRAMSHIFGPHTVQYLVDEYHLGCYETNRYPDNVLFPSIDIHGRVHNIKLQHYNCDADSPDFLHCDHAYMLWMAKKLAEQGIISNEARYDTHSLFGEHLLMRYPATTVILVESPKNALVGAAQWPKYVWLATGNCGALTEQAMQCLAQRDVIVFPDRDAIPQWTEKLKRMRHLANFTVSDICERLAPPDAKKYDIADLIIQAHSPDPRLSRDVSFC